MTTKKPKKRIIPCLDIKNGRTVKGINFVNLIDAGDPVELAKRYVEEGADELVFLDITATVEERKTLITLVTQMAAAIKIPFTIGGGIHSVEEAREIIQAGATKISINSSAVKRPELINELVEQFGSERVVLAIDAKLDGNDWKVYTHGGNVATTLAVTDWAREVEQRGAGEILLTSMNHDGTKDGFALDITQAVSETVTIPVIASGGAGTLEHFADVLTKTKANAALAASVFHFGEISIPQLKAYLATKNIAV